MSRGASSLDAVCGGVGEGFGTLVEAELQQFGAGIGGGGAYAGLYARIGEDGLPVFLGVASEGSRIRLCSVGASGGGASECAQQAGVAAGSEEGVSAVIPGALEMRGIRGDAAVVQGGVVVELAERIEKGHGGGRFDVPGGSPPVGHVHQPGGLRAFGDACGRETGHRQLRLDERHEFDLAERALVQAERRIVHAGKVRFRLHRDESPLEFRQQVHRVVREIERELLAGCHGNVQFGQQGARGARITGGCGGFGTGRAGVRDGRLAPTPPHEHQNRPKSVFHRSAQT